jgi:hypothetical protein
MRTPALLSEIRSVALGLAVLAVGFGDVAGASPVDREAESVSFSADEPRTSALTGAPMSLASMGFGLEYERSVAPRLSLFASLEGSLMWKGYGGQAGARVYAGERRLEGLFLDAHAGAYKGRIASGQYVQWGGGMLVGHSWIVGDGLLFSVGGGADLKQLDTEQNRPVPSCVSLVCYAELTGEDAQANGLRVTPSLRAAIGYAF